MASGRLTQPRSFVGLGEGFFTFFFVLGAGPEKTSPCVFGLLPGTVRLHGQTQGPGTLYVRLKPTCTGSALGGR